MRFTLAVPTVSVALTRCARPRAHTGVRVTPDGMKVVRSMSTSIAGIGVTVNQ